MNYLNDIIVLLQNILEHIGEGGITKAEVQELINTAIEDLKGKTENSAIKIKYNDLVNLKLQKKLKPGTWYRITDYECTTTQENTRSAGHKFDILVFAIDNHTLSEEARACINEAYEQSTMFVDDGNRYVNTGEIFTVTDATGRTTKATFFERIDSVFMGYFITGDVNDWKTKKASGVFVNTIKRDSIDRENKIAITKRTEFNTEIWEDILHSSFGYFSDCNLSAWKIWYCLDNDTTRFAWANDGILIKANAESVFANGGFMKRMPSYDGQYQGEEEFIYAWGTDADIEDGELPYNLVYTKNKYPKIGDIITGADSGSGNITEIQIGKGVIYRMIDEWNNDVSYDFKNIQYLRSRSYIQDYELEGYYSNERNADCIWAYTFCHIEDTLVPQEMEYTPHIRLIENDTYERCNVYDRSIQNNEDGFICRNNVIGSHCYDRYDSDFELNNIVMYNCMSIEVDSGSAYCTFEDCTIIKGYYYDSIIINSVNIRTQTLSCTLLYRCDNLKIDFLDNSILTSVVNITIGKGCGNLNVNYSKNLTFMNYCRDVTLLYVRNSTFYNGTRNFSVSSYESLYEGNEIENLVVFGGDYNGSTMYFYPNDEEVKLVTADGYSWHQTQGNEDV